MCFTFCDIQQGNNICIFKKVPESCLGQVSCDYHWDCTGFKWLFLNIHICFLSRNHLCPELAQNWQRLVYQMSGMELNGGRERDLLNLGFFFCELHRCSKSEWVYVWLSLSRKSWYGFTLLLGLFFVEKRSFILR